MCNHWVFATFNRSTEWKHQGEEKNTSWLKKTMLLLVEEYKASDQTCFVAVAVASLLSNNSDVFKSDHNSLICKTMNVQNKVLHCRAIDSSQNQGMSNG